MKQQREKQIAEFLQAHPWSSHRFIQKMISVPRDIIYASVGNESQYFKKEIALSERVSGRRRRQTLYALTPSGSKKQLGSFQQPNFLASALGAAYERLAIARHILLAAKEDGLLNWSMAPWRTGRQGMLFDALLCVSRSGDERKAYLLALMLTPQFATLAWYEQVLREWHQWRKDMSFAKPATLVFWNATQLNKHTSTYLSQFVHHHSGGVLLHRGKRLDLAQLWTGTYLSGENKVRRSDEVLVPPWHRASFDRQAHLPAQRKSRPRQQLFRESASEASELEHIQLLVKLSSSAIRLLLLIAAFPTSNKVMLVQLHKDQQLHHDFSALIKTLAGYSLIEEIAEWPGQYQATRRGIALAGLLHGVPLQWMDRFLGWPVRPRMYSQQRQHTERVQSFMLELGQEGLLQGWDFMRSRYRFYGIQTPEHGGKHSEEIYPDSAGYLTFNDGFETAFWLEVDRGTRRSHKRIHRQLEKYFRIRYASVSPVPIPPLVYIVDCDVQKQEARLRRIMHILGQLHQKYQASTLRVLFATGASLDDRGGLLEKACIWRLYERGQNTANGLQLQDGLQMATIRIQRSRYRRLPYATV